MAQRQDLLRWSFIACLVGGLLILVGGLAMAAMMVLMGQWMPHTTGGPFPGNLLVGMAAWMAAWSLLMGALALVAAARIRASPEQATGWGITAIVAGGLSFVTMSGFVLGSLAVVVGGVLAVLAGQQSPAGAQP